MPIIIASWPPFHIFAISYKIALDWNDKIYLFLIFMSFMAILILITWNLYHFDTNWKFYSWVRRIHLGLQNHLMVFLYLIRRDHLFILSKVINFYILKMLKILSVWRALMMKILYVRSCHGGFTFLWLWMHHIIKLSFT